MPGLIENVLTQLFGPPFVASIDSAIEHRWNVGDSSDECDLFKGLLWDDNLRKRHGTLEDLYGDAKGGFLLGDSLKVSLLKGPSVFGLYQIDELRCRPEVKYANELDPEISFFMDSANVWFYGLKNDELVVYDCLVDELYSRGPVRAAFQQVVTDVRDAR